LNQDETSTADRILDGLSVLDLGGTSAVHMAARIFADLGATVIRIELDHENGYLPPREQSRDLVWSLGVCRVQLQAGSPELEEVLEAADIVLATPYQPGVLTPDRPAGFSGVWVDVTPFGLAGPRSRWRASDLGVMASSGNLYLSGYGDRAPVRCAEPLSDAHVGPEIVVAALLARASGAPQEVDLSAQEAILMANMGLADRARTTGEVVRRDGGRGGVGTSQVWECIDGFIGLGLNGGTARQKTMDVVWKLMAEDGIECSDLSAEPWTGPRWLGMSDAEKDDVIERFTRFFSGRSAQQLQDLAYSENLMMAAVLRAPEVLASEQLAARDFFTPLGGDAAEAPLVPGPMVRVISSDGSTKASPRPGGPPRRIGAEQALSLLARRPGRPAELTPWCDLTMVEFAVSGAGPLIGRYFAEQGAEVLRIESRKHPDYLRVMWANADYGFDNSPMFDSLNPGKRSVGIDLSRPEGIRIARTLALGAHAVFENFAPRTLPKLGLDYSTLVADRQDLIMLSSCLNGQTGPHRDFPGFGGQGSALSGYTFLTGWPDRVPLGPAQAVTDSVSPRFAALMLGALLERRARTGHGGYVDLSQVETAAWTLSPWLLSAQVHGSDDARHGNRDVNGLAVPHGLFPCRGIDRWVAIAIHDDEDWARLAPLLGDVPREWSALAARQRDINAVEAALSRWTQARESMQCAGILQSHDIEAVPVSDGVDNLVDPQLHARGHYQVGTHPTLGERLYERNGFRVSGIAAGYAGPSALLGADTKDVLGRLTGMSTRQINALIEEGVLG
jgi:crotonobetainyl-CoA:carnitine CoA-transferase CaiB-like acyl-CoA transferase